MLSMSVRPQLQWLKMAYGSAARSMTFRMMEWLRFGWGTL